MRPGVPRIAGRTGITWIHNVLPIDVEVKRATSAAYTDASAPFLAPKIRIGLISAIAHDVLTAAAPFRPQTLCRSIEALLFSL
jgi:hypothetical protein